MPAAPPNPTVDVPPPGPHLLAAMTIDRMKTAAASTAAGPAAIARLLPFRCNLCGTVNRVPLSALERETPSCSGCDSTVRFRSIVHLLTQALFALRHAACRHAAAQGHRRHRPLGCRRLREAARRQARLHEHVLPRGAAARHRQCARRDDRPLRFPDRERRVRARRAAGVARVRQRASNPQARRRVHLLRPVRSRRRDGRALPRPRRLPRDRGETAGGRSTTGPPTGASRSTRTWCSTAGRARRWRCASSRCRRCSASSRRPDSRRCASAAEPCLAHGILWSVPWSVPIVALA